MHQRVHALIATGDAVFSAKNAVLSGASSKESERENAPVDEGRPDSPTAESGVQGGPCLHNMLTYYSGCACSQTYILS